MDIETEKAPEFPALIYRRMKEPKLEKTKERWAQENKATARQFLEYVVDVLQDNNGFQVVVEDIMDCPHRSSSEQTTDMDRKEIVEDILNCPCWDKPDRILKFKMNHFHDCSVCGSKITRASKSRHEKTRKHKQAEEIWFSRFEMK